MALPATSCIDLEAVCSASQFPAGLAELTSQQPLRSTQPQKGFLCVPRHLFCLAPDIKEISFSLLSLQMEPLADENKELFMGSSTHHLLLHYIFYSVSRKAFPQTSAIVFLLADGTMGKAQKVKWISEGHFTSQIRGERGI